MKRVVRWLGWGMLVVALILSVAGAAGYWWLCQALPEVAGEVTVEGLTAPVEIVRDRHGIPHIQGQDDTDVIFAQGFAHAQDRLWQMEFQRRVGAGRLAEIVGAPGLPTDRFMRVLGLYRLAEASIDHLSADSLAWLDAYAAGVNAFLATRSGPLSPEFLLLGHADLEPWRPADSVVWIKMMALDLSLNWRSELLRARLAKRLSDEQIADLWPTYPDDAPVTLTALARDLDLEQLAAVLPPAPPPGLGSNAWVVDGEHSRTGAPLLANDPHLGLRAPGAWYLAHLKSPELELIGAGLPGVPGIVLGHNGTIAWGMTNTGPDSQDLFVERIDPADSSRYLTPEGSASFETRKEVIRVKDAASVTFDVRTTRHGPVLSDVLTGTDQVLAEDQLLALAWTAFIEGDTSVESLFDLTKATDWAGFLDAVEGNDVPQQNVFYADRTGHIGFVAPGRVPIRKRGDGLWPVPGWTGEYDWIGTIPREELPRDRDPALGRFLNGNNRVVPEDYPHLITAIWEPPYRARRIDALLGGRQHDLETFAAMQLDQLSLLAVDFLPFLLETTPTSEPAETVIDDLRAWDRVMRAEAPEPLIFAAWYRELGRLIYADELGPLFPAFWNIRPQFMERVLIGKTAWCDDQSTAGKETCQDVAAKALDLALDDLRQRFGDDRSAWRWGTAHPARMAHAVVDGQPVLEDVFNIQYPTGGDSVTINVGHYALVDDQRPFTSVQGASYRGLYDLADLDRSRFIAATGQSGHPLSPHYRDLSALWAAGRTISMNRDPKSYANEIEGRLSLTPKSPSEQGAHDKGTHRN